MTSAIISHMAGYAVGDEMRLRVTQVVDKAEQAKLCE